MQLFSRSLRVALFLQGLVATLITTCYGQSTLDEIARRYTKRTPGGGIHVPIVHREILRRDPVNGTGTIVGLGDVEDFNYAALVTVGGVTTPLLIDTGSSDLWVVSDICMSGKGCGTAKPYPQATLKSAGIGVELRYGDALGGTYASGLIGYDAVSLGTITLSGQSFAAINSTNDSTPVIGFAGIIGTGFPQNSEITTLLLYQNYSNTTTLPARKTNSGPFHRPSILDFLGIPPSESRHRTRQTVSPSPALVQAMLASWSTIGPFIPRLVTQAAIPQPMIAITLQRDVMDVGGNLGTLSIGELPSGVHSSDLTWVPVRGYSVENGGIPAPPNSPSEVYPLAWEVMLDNVYFDGEQLPKSKSTPTATGLSVLLDTGDQQVRGPEDVVTYVLQKLGTNGLFDCAVPHNLSFEIGGKMFPVDPRDFARQASVDPTICRSNLVITGPPGEGHLMTWSLGDPFLKGVLSAFYFGNLTYPSQDAPKIGLVSTVPADAGNQMKAAAASASKAGTFPDVTESAPSVLPTATATDSHGVPQASTHPNSNSSSTSHSAASSYSVCSAALSYLTLISILSLIAAM